MGMYCMVGFREFLQWMFTSFSQVSFVRVASRRKSRCREDSTQKKKGL